MSDGAKHPNGTVVRITSNRFGSGAVGKIGTITSSYPSHIDGLAYAVILEGSPAGTFHQCGAPDFEVIPLGTTNVPPAARCKRPIVGRYLHRWGNWKPYALTYQERRCLDCGLIQRRDT